MNGLSGVSGAWPSEPPAIQISGGRGGRGSIETSSSVKEPAVVRDRFLAEEPPDHLQPFVQTRPALLQGHADRGEFPLLPAGADTKDESASGKEVEASAPRAPRSPGAAVAGPGSPCRVAPAPSPPPRAPGPRADRARPRRRALATRAGARSPTGCRIRLPPPAAHSLQLPHLLIGRVRPGVRGESQTEFISPHAGVLATRSAEHVPHPSSPPPANPGTMTLRCPGGVLRLVPALTPHRR